MARHLLKIWPAFYSAVLDGSKKAEVRKFDRDFKVDDTLLLEEYEPRDDQDRMPGQEGFIQARGFTGHAAEVSVTHIVQPGTFGLPADVGVMSIRLLGELA